MIDRTDGGRVIEIEVSGATARLELLHRTAPNASTALWETLPIRGLLTHARWAGSACWTKVHESPLADITGFESQATSIYRGTLAVRPGNGRAELFLSYGQAESRHEQGRTYVTPVARVLGDAEALYDALAATWKDGAASVEIRRGPRA
jgi:hypothetical protein